MSAEAILLNIQGYLIVASILLIILLLLNLESGLSRFGWGMNFTLSASYVLVFFLTFFNSNFDIVSLTIDTVSVSVTSLSAAKLLALLVFCGLSLMGLSFSEEFFTIDFIFLILVGQIAGLLVLSADQLIGIFLLLEAQALVSYSITIFKRLSLYSTEAGLKYFLFGAISGSLFALGLVLLFSNGGTFFLQELSSSVDVLKQNLFISFSSTFGVMSTIVWGLLFILFGLLFKLSAFPFHFWTPDVYQDSEYLTIGYFSTIPKIATLGFLSGVGFILLTGIKEFLIISGLFSLIIGAVGGVYQNSFHRLMAYSTISNSAFILLILAIPTVDNTFANGYWILVPAWFQMFVYSLTVISLLGIVHLLPHLGVFSVLSYLRHAGFAIRVTFSLLLFSIAGIPPLLGFASKYFLVSAFFQSNSYFLVAVLIILFSLLNIFYYTSVVGAVNFSPIYKDLKTMYYFIKDKPEDYFFFYLFYIPVSLLTIFGLVYTLHIADIFIDII